MSDIFDSDYKEDNIDKKAKRYKQLRKIIKEKYPEILELLDSFYKEEWN